MINELCAERNARGIAIRWLTPIVQEMTPSLAHVTLEGRYIGTVRRNDYGFWVGIAGGVRRYYTNPVPAAYDMLVAEWITKEEAAREWPPYIERTKAAKAARLKEKERVAA